MTRPTLIVEAAFNIGVSTSPYWHIGDPARGKIGTFLLGPAVVYNDITSYVQGLTMQAGASSRVTSPLVQYEAGSAQIPLNNTSRAFDPLNVSSPFYTPASTNIIPVPGTLPNADVADGTGTAFDAQVNAQASALTYAAAGFASGSGSANNATVTGTTTVNNVPNGMLFGASPGGNGASPIAATTTLLHPKMWRVFETTPTSWANTQNARFVPTSVQQFISFKYSPTTLSNTASSGYSTTVGYAVAILSQLSDIPGHWCAEWHEPQGDSVDQGGSSTWTIPEWQAAQVNFRHDVVDVVNATRTHPIFFANPMNGFLSTTQANVWYTSAVLAVHDAIGWDCYGYANTPPQDQALAGYNYALSKGKRLIIPEIGSLTGGTATSTTDAQELSTMQSVMNHIASWSTATRPLAVLWFNGNSSAVNGKPNAAAYWKNVCDTSTVYPT